jgi:hypothetical protein
MHAALYKCGIEKENLNLNLQLLMRAALVRPSLFTHTAHDRRQYIWFLNGLSVLWSLLQGKFLIKTPQTYRTVSVISESWSLFYSRLAV